MSIRHLFDYSQPLVAAATVLSVGFVVVSGVLGYVVYTVKASDDMITVTGSAKEMVRADAVRWTIQLETKTGTDTQQAGIDRLEAAQKRIAAYLAGKGVTEVESPVASVYPNYSYPDRSEPIFIGYTVSRSVIVRSSDVAALSALANDLSKLQGSGYTVSTNSLELTYSKLDEMRVKLLTQAIGDAEARARAIAEETGRSVHVLRSASSGVVQVLPAGGIDISDYGSYDTQSMSKDIMVTVRAEFSLR